MAFFKKKQKDNNSNKTNDANARIKVLGSGCKKCLTLESNVKVALNNSNKDDSVTHITDMEKIIAYGVMTTPALVIDEKVVSSGKVLSVKEIEKLL